MICVRRTFLATCCSVEFRVLRRGRAISITVHSTLGSTCFVCLHLPPQLSVDDSQGFLRDIFRALPPRRLAYSFLSGDWNFLASGEPSLDLVIGKPSYRQDGIARYFDSLSDDFTELHQDEPTRMDSSSLSRLDRIYTNLPLGILSQLSILGGVKWSFHPSRGQLSDHVPVFSPLLTFPMALLGNSGRLGSRLTHPLWTTTSSSFLIAATSTTTPTPPTPKV